MACHSATTAAIATTVTVIDCFAANVTETRPPLMIMTSGMKVVVNACGKNVSLGEKMLLLHASWNHMKEVMVSRGRSCGRK